LGASRGTPKRVVRVVGAGLGPFGRRFAWAAAYFAVLFAVGAVGYVVIEGWGWHEALYQSVTSITSVGFMEVHPLSRTGRTFTMGLVLLGVTGLGIWWGLITALIVEFDLRELFRERRRMREISSLSDHFIICGIGRMGRVVATEMHRSGMPCVVVEREAARIRELQEALPDLLFLEGDATREHTLELARVATARGVASCLTDDGDNLLVAITARSLSPQLTIVARAHDEEVLHKLRRAGADHAISPNVTGGIRMASTLIRPSVVSFLDVSTSGGDVDLRLEEAPIRPGSPVAGITLAEARIPQRTGLVVLALRRAEGSGGFQYNPGPETRLERGDVILVLGRPKQVAALRDYVRGTAGP